MCVISHNLAFDYEAVAILIDQLEDIFKDKLDDGLEDGSEARLEAD